MQSRFFYLANTGSLGEYRRSTSFLEPNHTTSDAFGAATAQRTRSALVKPMILVAEDDEDGRVMMLSLLGLKGYDVIQAANGLEAVEVALTKFPAMILLDLDLPLLNGFAVTRNLRRHPRFKQVPIVVVSAYDAERHRQPALEAGCSDYLSKPIDFDRLDEILNSNLPLASGSDNDV